MKSIIEKIESRLKELNEVKQNLIKNEFFNIDKDIEIMIVNRCVTELNKLLDENN